MKEKDVSDEKVMKFDESTNSERLGNEKKRTEKEEAEKRAFEKRESDRKEEEKKLIYEKVKKKTGNVAQEEDYSGYLSITKYGWDQTKFKVKVYLLSLGEGLNELPNHNIQCIFGN